MRRRTKIALGLAALLVAVTYVPLGDWDDQAVVMVRDDAGAWTYEGDAPSEGELHATRWSTETDITGGHGLDGRGEAWRCERVWILNTSSSGLARSVGLALQRQLLADETIWEVAYFGIEDLPLDVRRPPDLFVLVRELESSGLTLPGWHRASGSFLFEAARSLRLEGSTLDGNGTSPQISAVVDYRTRSFGISNPGARRLHVARNVARGLDLLGTLQGIDEERPRTPSPDLAWIGDRATAPTDLPPFGDDVEAQPLYVKADWLVHEESAWFLTCADGSEAFHARYTAALEEAGWSVHDPRGGIPDMEPRSTSSLDARRVMMTGHNACQRTDTGPLVDALVLVHRTRFTGDEIAELFLSHPDDWDAMIPHLGRVQRRDLRAALTGRSGPAADLLEKVIASAPSE